MARIGLADVKKQAIISGTNAFIDSIIALLIGDKEL